MNRRKYISALLSTIGIGAVGFSAYSKNYAKAEISEFNIEGVNESNLIELSISSSEIDTIRLNLTDFRLETHNIRNFDENMDINISASIDDNSYSDIVSESILLNESNENIDLLDDIEFINITNENIDEGEFPKPDGVSKKISIKITVNHVDLTEEKTIEDYFYLDIIQEGIEASGGEIYDIDSNGVIHRIHAFTDVGEHTFEITNEVDIDDVQLDVLVVGGGGGGGLTYGSGGGAGGLVFEPNKSIDNKEVSLYVGSGGHAGKHEKEESNYPGRDGEDSIFGSLTAIGGGGGATDGNYANNGDGGSGGGGNNNNALQPSSDSGGFGNEGGEDNRVSGGGGAGEDGETNIGGDGLKKLTVDGIEYSFAQFFGLKYGEIINDEVWFSGGGVGQRNAPDGGIDGNGNGGGGDGEENPPDRPDLKRIGRKGMPNTGGGGAGANTGPADAGNGGSGIVLVRYPIEHNDSTDNIMPSSVCEDFERNVPLIRDWTGNTDKWNLENSEALYKNQSISISGETVDDSVIGLQNSQTGRLPNRGDEFSFIIDIQDISDEHWFGFGMDSNNYNPASDSGYAVKIGEGDKLSIYKDGESQVDESIVGSNYNNKTIEIKVEWNSSDINVKTFEFNSQEERRKDKINEISFSDSTYENGIVSIAAGGGSKKIFDRIWIINAE